MMTSVNFKQNVFGLNALKFYEYAKHKTDFIGCNSRDY